MLAGAVAISLLAWAWTFVEARRMDAMLELAMTPTFADWSAAHFVAMLAMWAIMMVAMMTPSATPLLLLHARIQRQKDPGRRAPAATLAFAGGYLLAWTGFSLGATGLQWGLERWALLAPTMTASSPWLGFGFLAAAGIYQTTSYKDACLRHCRSPVQFVSEHWRPGTRGALRMGLEHGVYCIGCCWVLMLLLFVGGVMNLVWIAALSVFVLLEKLAPKGQWLRWAGAAVLHAGALWWLSRALA